MPDDAPTIPHFWWLKRLAAVVVVWLVGWAGIHWWFTNHVAATEAALLAEWRDDGGPHPDMLATATGVPPNHPDNAAYDLVTAFKSLPMMTQAQMDWESNRLTDWTVPTEADEPVLASIERANQNVFDTIRAARGKVTFDWGLPAANFVALRPHLFDLRETATRLRWSSLFAWYNGDIPAALERLRDLEFLARSAPHDGPSLLSSIVATGIHSIATKNVLEIAQNRPPGLSPAETHAAWRDARPQVKALIAELLDEEIERTLIDLAFRGERVSSASVVTSILTPSSGTNFIIEPVFRADMLRMAQQLDTIADAAQATETMPDWLDELDRRGMTIDQSSARTQTIARSFTRALSAIMMPTIDPSLIAFSRLRAVRRTAAVQLAVRLYEADHEGDLPPTLESLVPEYLPFVPRDPFARGDQPLRYRIDLALPIIYSVGENFTDEGGSVVPSDPRGRALAKRRGLDTKQYENEDFVIPLRPSPIDGVDPWNYLYDGGKALLKHESGLRNEARP